MTSQIACTVHRILETHSSHVMLFHIIALRASIRITLFEVDEKWRLRWFRCICIVIRVWDSFRFQLFRIDVAFRCGVYFSLHADEYHFRSNPNIMPTLRAGRTQARIQFHSQSQRTYSWDSQAFFCELYRDIEKWMQTILAAFGLASTSCLCRRILCNSHNVSEYSDSDSTWTIIAFFFFQWNSSSRSDHSSSST